MSTIFLLYLLLHVQVLEKARDQMMSYNGCGLIAPEALKDARVLGLGCGAAFPFEAGAAEASCC